MTPQQTLKEQIQAILREAYYHGELRSANACLVPLEAQLLALYRKMALEAVDTVKEFDKYFYINPDKFRRYIDQQLGAEDKL